MIQAILKGLGLGLFLSIAVGPVIFAIIKLSMKHGHKAGYAFIAGVSVSDIFMVVLGNVAAELMQSVLSHKNTVAMCGAVLLMIMGFYSLFFKKDPKPEEGELAIEFRKRDLAKFSLQGFFMNSLNPGPIFFWLTACTSLAYLPLKERAVVFITTLAMVLGTDVVKVALAGRIRNLLTPKTLHIITRISALILIGFGLAIVGGIVYTYYNP